MMDDIPPKRLDDIETWLKTAPAWASKPLVNYREQLPFWRCTAVHRWVIIDPSAIIGTADRYFIGRSVREILEDSLKPDFTKSRFKRFPGYWKNSQEDPSWLNRAREFAQLDPASGEWCLDQVNDEYFVVNDDFRSIMAKVLHDAGLLDAVIIPKVHKIEIDDRALTAYRRLRDHYKKSAIKIDDPDENDPKQEFSFSLTRWSWWKQKLTTEKLTTETVLQRYGKSNA